MRDASTYRGARRNVCLRERATTWGGSMAHRRRGHRQAGEGQEVRPPPDALTGRNTGSGTMSFIRLGAAIAMAAASSLAIAGPSVAPSLDPFEAPVINTSTPSRGLKPKRYRATRSAVQRRRKARHRGARRAAARR